MPPSSEQPRPAISVSVHLTRLVILVAVTLGLVVGVLEVTLEYFRLRATLLEHSEQVTKAFQNIAARAIADRDMGLAAQVTDGLFEFRSIVSVELSDETGNVLGWKERDQGDRYTHWLPFDIPSNQDTIVLRLSPPGSGGETKGYLKVVATSERATQIWANQLGMVLISVLVGTLVFACILLLISHRYLTRPMMELAQYFRSLDVSDPKNSPLPNPDHFRFREFRGIAEDGVRMMRDIARNSEVRDLTANELYRSQKRLQDFAEISSDWFWESDRDGGVTYTSPSFTKTLNKKTGEIYGRTIAETTTEDTKSPKWHKLAEIQRQRRQFRDFRYDMEVQPGVVKTVSINGRPFYDEDGTFIGYRGTGADVTNERLIAQARNEALQRAEQASRTKSEFLATMSHEFRTPLNAIIGFSSLLSMPEIVKASEDRLTDYSTAINESGQHMLALVNDILDISAIEAGKRVLNYEAVGIDSLISHCLSQVERQAGAKDIKLETALTSGAGPIVSDERSLRQILLNLLSNAVKFTPAGGTVRLSVEETPGEFVFRVADNGVGIPQERLPTIAEPFSHSAMHPHVAKEGTGLGLSIVRSLSVLLDGSFEIDSEAGLGTTVTIRLPRNTAEAPDNAANKQATSA
ncbi:PAS domain-containing sensor histidine kinase [Nisaea acidiphila]|uniref:histidine kinase n=1 Tax=Nisaea acidiphila TaxID=1862145 RepID=A0A9J7ASN5_9PROT|nr:PAS domain-containing sensor histidine kinase [Nisaea acidiphila]UUX50683.1 PAS domain-containing sensor histidine kinase [Nisaea acidiphila]